MFTNWLHKILNPHCQECKETELETRRCNSCDTYKVQLEHERYQNQQLLNLIIEINSPKKPIEYTETETPIPIPNTRFANFAEKRKQLEAQSKIEAQRLEQLKKDSNTSDKVEGIQELEEMVGI